MNKLAPIDRAGRTTKGIDAVTAFLWREFDVSGLTYVSVQARLASNTGSGSHSIWTMEVSNDGIAYVGIPAGAVTLTTPGLTTTIDVRAFAYLRVRLSTLATYTTELVDLILVGTDVIPIA